MAAILSRPQCVKDLFTQSSLRGYHMSIMASQINGNQFVKQTVLCANFKENIKACITGPL